MTETQEEAERRRRRREERQDSLWDAFAGVAPWLFGVLVVVLGVMFVINSFTNFISGLNPFGTTTEVTGTDVGEFEYEAYEGELRCQGRIKADVPVEVDHQPKLAGIGIPATSRTVEVRVVGGMDTCVEPGAVTDVDELSDGVFQITINRESVIFQEASLDALETVTTEDDSGFLRDPLEALPFVGFKDDLSPQANAYGQVVIDVNCAPRAASVTEDAITHAYSKDFAERLGVNPDDIIIVFENDFEYNERVIPDEILDGVTARVVSEKAVCIPAEGSTEQDLTVAQ